MQCATCPTEHDSPGPRASLPLQPAAQASLPRDLSPLHTALGCGHSQHSSSWPALSSAPPPTGLDSPTMCLRTWAMV